MSEESVITPGSKVKRGAIVTSGEATIVYPEKDAKKAKPSPLRKYQCPDKCLSPQSETPEGGRKRKPHPAKVWVQVGDDENYARLLPCAQCGKSLEYVPNKRAEEDSDIPF